MESKSSIACVFILSYINLKIVLKAQRIKEGTNFVKVAHQREEQLVFIIHSFDLSVIQ